MAEQGDAASDSWYQSGVFRFFSFEEEIIHKFTIDPKLSLVVRKQEKEILRKELVEGKCKSCNFVSRVH